MDKKICKLRNLVLLYLNNSKKDITEAWGEPTKNSDSEIWFYSRFRWGIFRDEIAFIFEGNEVIDINLTEYFLWWEHTSVFYYQNETPEYKAFKIL